MVVVIASTAHCSDRLCAFGLDCQWKRPEELPSLTGFLMDNPGITHLVIQCDGKEAWSDVHILAAAKQLRERGGVILTGSGDQLLRLRGNPLLGFATDDEALLSLLSGKKQSQVPNLREKTVPPGPTVRPIRVPPSATVVIDVVGSQSRIGCTTQAITLWHYFKALGFRPAVICSPELIELIAPTMDSRRIDGGYVVDGVVFLTAVGSDYNCFIRDCGCGSGPARGADWVILVAGVKPWELQHTMRTVRSMERQASAVLLSFAEPAACQQLRVLFGSAPSAPAPWIPDPWHPASPVLTAYDKLLRKQIEYYFEKEYEINVY